MGKEIVVLRSSQKDVLIEEINQKLDETTRKVHLSIRPTINILASILTAAPNTEVITCPPSLYERTPKKIRTALEKIGIKFEPLLLTPGRPRSHPNWKIQKVYELEKKGYSAKEISDALDIPLTTVYYYLKKEENENKKKREKKK
ncbi:terminase gpP N-terminus-related DNA-binding protein [Candidatus Pyrohabitans sp.]